MKAPKIDLNKLKWPEVPAGTRMVFRHIYRRPALAHIVRTQDGTTEYKDFPKQLLGTIALLVNEKHEVVAQGETEVSRKDVPIKKLGRCIAHNRCIKDYYLRLAEQKREAANARRKDTTGRKEEK